MIRKAFGDRSEHFPWPWRPVTADWSISDGRLVHLKGQVALDRDGNVVGKGDMAAQLVQVFDNIATVLEYLGGRMADVFALNTFTTDIETFMTLGEIRARYFKPPYPVTTTIEISRLYHPELSVEVGATAEIPHERFKQGK